MTPELLPVRGLPSLVPSPWQEIHSPMANARCFFRPAMDSLRLGEGLAVQLLPREEDWTNLHPHTLHLFRRLDGDTLPELAPGGRALT